MNKIKIIFMGTPDFSVPVLKGLIENYDVIGVVTQPDKEVGRKRQVTFSPIKQVAISHSIPVFQPVKIRNDYENILALRPDMIVTCAYGQIIPKVMLDAPKYGCVNVHASLLPKLRGGAPIHHAILDNYPKTGITIMYMVEKMDAGDIIAQVETIIKSDDTVGSLHDRLSVMGRDLLLETLPKIIKGDITPIPQKEEEVTFGYNIKREEELVTFDRITLTIYNHIRGLNPHPGAYAILDNNVVKLYNSRISSNFYNQKIPGEISRIYDDGIGVATKDGEIIITELQFAGKKRMLGKDYLNGTNPEKLLGKIFNEE